MLEVLYGVHHDITSLPLPLWSPQLRVSEGVLSLLVELVVCLSFL